MERNWGGCNWNDILRTDHLSRTGPLDCLYKAQKTQQELVQWSSSWDVGPERTSPLEDSQTLFEQDSKQTNVAVVPES